MYAVAFFLICDFRIHRINGAPRSFKRFTFSPGLNPFSAICIRVSLKLVGETPMISRLLRKASLMRYICFAQERKPWSEILETVHEMREAGWIELKLSSQACQRFTNAHTPKFKFLKKGYIRKYSKKDLHLIQAQSRELAHAIDCISTFGERVIQCRKKNPNALVWDIAGSIGIERAMWNSLRKITIRVLRWIDFNGNLVLEEPWPHFYLLATSVERAKQVFVNDS